MKELRKKIAELLYYYGAVVIHIQETEEDLPDDVKASIEHYYKNKDIILEEITKDNNES